MENQEPRQQLLKRHAALKSERSTWDAHWRDLGDYIHPRRHRFFTTDRNQGQKKNQKIINATPTWASNVLASGMMAGFTSQAQSWFRLSTPDPELAEYGSVRSWLHSSEERLRFAFARSNFYKSLPLTYVDLNTFGTSAFVMEDDPENFFRCYVLPIGSYCLATNDKQEVDTCFREVSMTVRQLVSKFGEKKCSQRVRDAYAKKDFESWHPIVHAIYPNAEYQQGRLGPAGKRWKSCWMEVEAPPDTGFLREDGYEEFPVLAPRWSLTGEDVYGSCPGMEALGDARALQLLERRKAQLVDKLANPPMKGPTSLLRHNISLLPGETTLVDSVSAGQSFSPALEIQPGAVQAVELSIREHMERIKRHFHADAWLMLSQRGDGQKTATEVEELREEKLLQLGPVAGQVLTELLEPAVNRALAILFRNGDLPPPPPELQGQELKVEFLNIFAAAQKIVATSAIRQVATFVGNASALWPDIRDKFNYDQAADEMGSALGVKPEILRTDEEVAAIRAARAKQQAAAAQAQMAAEAVKGAQALSETSLDGNTALSQLVGPLASSGVN